MLFLALFLLTTARHAISQPEAPQNVTITFLDARTVQVRWSSRSTVDKFDVTYKPIEAKVVTAVAGNSGSVTLQGLEPDTQYQVTVTATHGGIKARSRPVVFRTMAILTEAPPLEAAPHPHSTPSVDDLNSDPTGSRFAPITSVTVRGVEISLVLLALVVWIFAIFLFFHRWGKIRMLLPYQPDYKTQQSLKVPGTSSSIGQGDGPGHPEAPGCVQQHLRWSSRYLDEPVRPPSRWSSRHRLSCANFSGYVRTSTECESPERMRHARSHNSLHRLSIPVPSIPRQRGSIHSLLDCLRNQQDIPETQPLFFVQEPAVQETQLNGSPPPKPQPTGNPVKRHKTSEEETKPKHLRPAEMKRKAFLRKISLQETHLNYNQDYWLEYEKSTRFHTSLDLGYFNGDGDTTTAEKQGPIINNLEPMQAINESTIRQSEMPLKHKKLFVRGNSEPYIVRKKCSCNGCGTKTSSEESAIVENVVATPSNENLPLFMERVGHIETDFEGLDRRSESEFSDVPLNGCISKSATFDFQGGDAFFGRVQGYTSSDSEDHGTSPSKSQRPFSVPIVSVIQPSNSPSPHEPDITSQ